MTYMSVEFFEGMEKVESVEVDNPCGTCLVSSESPSQGITKSILTSSATLS